MSDAKTRAHVTNLNARILSAKEAIGNEAVSDDYCLNWMKVAYDILVRLHGEQSDTPIRVAYWQPAAPHRNECAAEVKKRLLQTFQASVDQVAAHVEMLESEFAPGAVDHSNHPAMAKADHVFVVHGHDVETKTQVARLLEQLSLQPILLDEQANKGRSILAKFTDHAAEASFAIVIMSADDEGREISDITSPKPRARQNVIFELGYFLAKLGPGRVCALTLGDPEIPSDFSGILVEKKDDRGAWKFNIAKELRAAGFKADANNIK